MQYTPLGIHSHYSLLSALSKPEDIVKKVQTLGMTSFALTDISVTSGFVETYKLAKKNGISLIFGCEFYLTLGSYQDQSMIRGEEIFQITVLAESYKGYQNILQLSSLAHLENKAQKPRIDREILGKYSEGLIVILGGMRCPVLKTPDHLKQEVLDSFLQIFGKHSIFFGIEFQPEIAEYTEANLLAKTLGQIHEIPLVLMQTVLYLEKDDKESFEVLTCIRDGVQLEDPSRERLRGDFSLHTPEEITQMAEDFLEAIENTNTIAARCKVSLPLGQTLIPSFPAPEGMTEESYLRVLCEEGMQKRYEDVTTELKERLDYELKVIHDMGFDAYFLIVWDFVYYAKTHDIMVGPGRGSAAGSIVAYTLGITDIDPIRFDLIFERFLNPERISMPDIDIDFIDTKRDQIIEYVQQKYGKDRVAQIITFGTMAARAAVRDAGRALGFSYGSIDRIAKAIPSVPGTKLPLALKEVAELKEMYREPDVKRVIDTALRLEGTIRNNSIHAAAVVIAKDPLIYNTALQEANKGEGIVVTQYSMKPIEELGLLKMDFLGLKNLQVIEQTLLLVKEYYGKEIDMLRLPLDDEKTYALLAEADTIGVFQFESTGMRRYLKDLQSNCIEDLIAMVSLYRPGPMQFISDFIQSKTGKKEIIYLDPCLEAILKETYGIIVYQEQIQKIAQIFAGYSLGEADLLRRAVGKKIKKEVDAQKEVFVQKAIQNGKSKELAEKIFTFVEPFADYGFNKSHAAAYAMISYQTAYLKANYPELFMTALMTADSDNTDRIIIEVADCQKMGISVLPPSINYSYDTFHYDQENKAIRFGLAAIKNIGEGPAKAILEARNGTLFSDLGDFVKRLDSKSVNKKVLESLAKSGALDEYAERNQVVENIDILLTYAKHAPKDTLAAQIDIFSHIPQEDFQNLELPEMIPATLEEKLAWEKELLGVYLSSHPLHGLQKYLNKYTTSVFSLRDLGEDTKVAVGGVITRVQPILTKKGQRMAFFQLEDWTSEIECVVFTKLYEEIADLLEEGNVIVAEAKISQREQNDEIKKSLVINKMRLVDVEKARHIDETFDRELGKDLNEKKVKEHKAKTEKKIPKKTHLIHIPDRATKDTLLLLKELLAQYPGDETVILRVPKNEDLYQDITVPFGITWSESLGDQVKTMFL